MTPAEYGQALASQRPPLSAEDVERAARLFAAMSSDEVAA